MDVLSHKSTSVEEFFEWVAHQEGRFELVGGEVRMMTGARRQHNIVKDNVAFALHTATRQRGCSTTTSDTGIRTGEQTVRYPDVVVDCGPSKPDDMLASAPSILIEVSSPSTRNIDVVVKLGEYQALPSVEVIMQVEPDVALVTVYRRSIEGWLFERYDGLDSIIDLPVLDTTLSLRSVYDGVEVKPSLQLVSRPSEN